MDSINAHNRKQKVVFVMGATGTGKSRLSVDLATRFSAEIINSDKIQIYEGLDIVTNKVTKVEQKGVPHHLLGDVDPEADFTPEDFSRRVHSAIESITGSGGLPIIVGGSNTYVEALVDDEENRFRSKYDCCFIWIDVALPVLHFLVSKRVDQMVESGLVDEVRQVFKPDGDYDRGIRRAIGVPELDEYLRVEKMVDEETRTKMLKAAVDETKANTFKLVCRQLEKLYRLKYLKGWDLHRVEATEVFNKKNSKEADKAWEELVVGPSTLMVRQFLNHGQNPEPAAAAAANGIPAFLGEMPMRKIVNV